MSPALALGGGRGQNKAAAQVAQFAGGAVIILGVAVTRAFSRGGLAGRIRARRAT